MSEPKPQKKDPNRGLVADAAGTLLTRVLTMGIGLFTGIITARVLGPESRGIFSLVALFPSTLVTLSKFGQAQAVIYFIRKEHVDVSRVASNVVTFALVVAAILVGGVIVFKDALTGSVLAGVPAWALLAVTPLIPILLIESYLYGVLQATDRFRVYNTRILADNVLLLVSMATALLVFDLGLPGALAAMMGTRIVMFVWVLRTVHQGSPIRIHFDTSLFRRTIRFGLKSHIQIIASHFHFRAAIYIVAMYSSPAQVAFYSIGARLAERIMYVPQSLGLALYPRLAGAEEKAIHEMTAAACRQTLVVTAAMAGVMTLFGGFVITLFYGEAYAEAAVPLPYIAWGIVMMSMYVLLSRNFTSRDRQRINIIAAYIALLGNVGLNVYLVPIMGIRGAAIGTAFAYTVAASILFVFFLRESGLPWHQVLVMRGADLERWRRFGAEAWGRIPWPKRA